jgi:CubicO group peptidase (beta-lactamase class C family)
VVIRHGKLCWEGGFPGGSTEKYQVYSVTKTFGAMLFGMIASRSQLSDEDPVTKWIAEADRGAINPKARLLHVLAMVSTNADLGPGKKGAWSYDTFGDREINRLAGVMDKAVAAEPARFPGVKDTVELAQKDLFDPLGMKSSSWAGDGNIASNLFSNVRDMARLGQLVLQRGRWNGRQLIDEEYLYRMTHPAFEDVNTGYGYLTYVNAAANWSWPTSTADLNCAPFGQWPGYPHRPLFESANSNGGVPGEKQQRYDIAHMFASGTGGQKFIVYRGVDLVIAIRNGAASANDGGTVVDQFPGHKTVWNAVRAAMLPFDPVYKGNEAGFCAAYRASDYAPDLREAWFKESVPQPAPASGPAALPVAPPVPACVTKRVQTITIRKPRGMKVRQVSVRLDGKRVRVRRGKRMTAVIDLRGRAPGLAVVRIRVTGVRRGKRATANTTRTFRTCGLTVGRDT